MQSRRVFNHQGREKDSRETKRPHRSVKEMLIKESDGRGDEALENPLIIRISIFGDRKL